MKSGRIQVYCSEDIARKIAHRAETAGLSTSSYAELILRKSLNDPAIQKFFEY